MCSSQISKFTHTHTHTIKCVFVATSIVPPVAPSLPFPPLSWCFITDESCVTKMNKRKVGHTWLQVIPKTVLPYPKLSSLLHLDVPLRYLPDTAVPPQCLHNTPVISMGTSPGKAKKEHQYVTHPF